MYSRRLRSGLIVYVKATNTVRAKFCYRNPHTPGQNKVSASCKGPQTGCADPAGTDWKDYLHKPLKEDLNV